MSRSVRGTARPAAPGMIDKPPLNMDMLASHLGFAMNRALMVLRRDFVTQFGDAGLRPMIFSMLVLIGANPGVLPTELADALALDKASVTNLLKDLLKRKWVEIHARHDDLRCKGIYISPEGARQLSQLKLKATIQAQKFDTLYTPAEKALLLESLQRIS